MAKKCAAQDVPMNTPTHGKPTTTTHWKLLQPLATVHHPQLARTMLSRCSKLMHVVNWALTST